MGHPASSTELTEQCRAVLLYTVLEKCMDIRENLFCVVISSALALRTLCGGFVPQLCVRGQPTAESLGMGELEVL